jgi:RNA polymerase sigma-70 factor (ECF subfamily)
MMHVAIARDGEGELQGERLLIARAQRGDRRAARELYDAHVRRVHQLIFRFCGNEQTAQDLTQETFIRVFRHLERFRGDSAFGTWVHRIAVRTALNGVRSEQRHLRFEGTLDDADAVADEQPQGDSHLRERLDRAIAALSEGARTVVILHDVEGYTHAEIGDLLGIAEGTSKARLFEARAKLRTLLAPLAPGKDG